MKVFVIMGNDFPECVFECEQAADEYVRARNAENKTLRAQYKLPPIHWKYYEFDTVPKSEQPTCPHCSAPLVEGKCGNPCDLSVRAA